MKKHLLVAIGLLLAVTALLVAQTATGEILSISRTEFSWAIVAFAGVVLVGTIKGIVVALIVSLVTLAHQVADPPVYVLPRKH